MCRIRAFQQDDIAAVADLWMKVFCRRESPSPDSLRSYFAEIFFGNPWSDPLLPSWVYEDDDRSIVGFVGVLPRSMTFRGRPIRVAVTSQFMVDTTKHRGLASVQLMRKVFEGSQDLSLTDGANDSVRRIWEMARGEVATMYCSVWTRILRPAEYLLEIAKEKSRSWRLLTGICKPFGAIVDQAAVRMRQSPYPVPVTESFGTEGDLESLLWCIERWPERAALRPNYDNHSLQWILQKAAEAKRRGDLQTIIVRDSKREILGWYVYYSKPGGISKVLQIGARDRGVREVILHLFHHAWQRGSVAVSGRFEPALVRELAHNHCGFTFYDLGVLLRSRNDDILNCVQRGQAFLTRLDGEWWMRFHEETWN